MDKDKYVQVLLPIPIIQEFTYLISPEWIGKLQFGQRLLVQFGSRKFMSGLVWKTHNIKPDQEIKSISGVLDTEPIVTTQQRKLWEWLADYYLCTLGEVMKASLPAGFKLESNTRLLVNEDYVSDEPFSELEELAWLFLQKNPGISISELGELLKRKNPIPVIHQLNKKGAILLEEKLNQSYRAKTETFYKLSSDYNTEESIHELLDSLNRARKQKSLIEYFLHQSSENSTGLDSPVSRKLLAGNNNQNSSILKALTDKGILVKQEVEISRISNPDLSVSSPKPLTEHQQNVYAAIFEAPQNSVHIIHGVTSSGKTEIYIHLIKSHLNATQQVLYLLPEIALTDQIIRRLQAVFGDSVGVFHSKHSDSERIELWKDLLTDNPKFNLIIGARSALFLPFKNLGLIIIDEEHDSSFKQQDPAPRYNARDTAVVMAKIHQAKVVMGTATPSLETYFNAKKGKFQLHQLTERFGQIPLPEIIISNTKEAYRKKKIRGHLTPDLLDAVDQALVNKEQVILFQNRRGYSPYLECDTCGHIPKCRDCDVSLTLHKFRNKIVCHYCGYSEPAHSICPSCENNSMRTKGLGTEGLEDEIGIIFPEAKIARLDMDTSRSKKGYSKIIGDFEDGKTNILVGTQMVTKGLDFSKVRVVGIINADNLLHFPDFRSFERGFQLMTQVSGRAGRRDDQGMVVIQTFDPTHRIIRQVLRNDYQGFYTNEMQERLNFGYPPYTRLIRLTIKHKNQEIVARCAYYVGKELRSKWSSRILGPQAPGISRIQQYHIRQILVKSAKGQEHKSIRNHIRTIICEMKKDKTFRSVIIIPDVDPL